MAVSYTHLWKHRSSGTTLGKRFTINTNKGEYSMVKWNLGIIGPGLIWQNIHAAIIKKLDQTFAVRAFCAKMCIRDRYQHRVFQ